MVPENGATALGLPVNWFLTWGHSHTPLPVEKPGPYSRQGKLSREWESERWMVTGGGEEKVWSVVSGHGRGKFGLHWSGDF